MILELSRQVVSLELAKRLKELKFSQSSLFYWQDNEIKTEENCSWGGITNFPLSAYTVSELGELLPFYLVNKGELTINKNHLPRPPYHGWNCRYEKTINCNGESLPVICADTQADSMARMLIHLKQNNLI